MSNKRKFEQPRAKTFKTWLGEEYGTKANRWWYYDLYSSDSDELNRPGKTKNKLFGVKDRNFRLFEDVVWYADQPFGSALLYNCRRDWYLCISRKSKNSELPYDYTCSCKSQ